MSRFLIGTILFAALVLAAPATAATVPKGPSGTDFYKPPQHVPSKHGTAIQWRKLSGDAVLKSARSNRLLLYSSTSTDGDAVAVSGTVAVPKGKAPKGGWPVVTWGHGTVGIADACAPSLVGMPGHYDSKLLNSWLQAGFAVVRTDYEGLGVPGEAHPYLIGVSEGRSMLDLVRAARRLDKKIGKNFVSAGHSQGGHAALWAGSLAKKWTPDLRLRGTLALAPASHLAEQASLLSALTSPSGVSGLAALIARGIDVYVPSLHVPALLSERAQALYPQVDSVCLGDLSAPTAFGALAPSELFAQGANVSAFIAALKKNDPDGLKLPGDVQIEQGSADTTVFPLYTTPLANDYKHRGVDVTYKTYKGYDHAQAVTGAKAAKDATAFVKRALRD
jgi:hypothetical protein